MSREPTRLRRRGLGHRAAGRRIARALGVLVAAGVAIAVGAGPALAEPSGALAAPLHSENEAEDGAAEGAAAEDAAAGEATESGAPEAELLLAAEQPALSGDETEVRFEILIRNPGAEPIPGGTIELKADPQPLDGLDVLSGADAAGGGTDAPGGDADEPDAADTTPSDAEAAEADAAGGIRIPLSSDAVGETAAEGVQRISVAVPLDRLPFALVGEPGVYAVLAELVPETDAGAGGADTNGTDALSSADPLLTGGTPIVWRGAELGAEAPLTVVVPLVLPARITAMPTPAQLSELAPRLDRLLTAAEAVDATLAIDPRIVAAIRGYGLEAPASARAFLTRLAASPLPTFLLQFADADPAAQSALGLEELLQPSGLEFMTRYGRFASETAADPNRETPNPLAPSLDELLDWPQGYAGAWPAAGEVDAATLTLLRDAGLTRLLLDSGNAAVSGGTRFALDGDLEAMVADASLGSTARRALAVEDELGPGAEVDRAAARATLAAEFALLAGRQSPGTVLALDRGAVADAADPAELVEWLGGLAWVAPVLETQQPLGTGSLLAGETAEERRELLRAAERRSASIDELAPLLVRPEYLTEYQRTRLLSVFATRYAEPGADFAAEVEERQERDEELLQGVQVVTTANTQLVSVSSQVPLQLHNSLPFDARVLLRVSPMSAGVSLPQQRFEEVPITAEGNQTVLVPVRSRISAGDSALLVQVDDAQGEGTYASALLPLTIRSSFETILLSGLGAAAALLFGFGIWRSVRQRRQARRAGAGTAGSATGSDADGAPGPGSAE